MTLNGVSLNQPPYGYQCEMYTGIRWNFVADNWRGYNNGFVYFKNRMNPQFDETMQAAYNLDFSAPMTLALSSGHGFYPYSPIFSDSSYSINVLNYGYSGVLKSPWQYTENRFETIFKPAVMPTFSYDAGATEGTFSIWGGGPDPRTDIVNGIREIDQPPNITMPNYYNVAIDQSGDPHQIVRRIPSFENAGIDSTINITGSAAKIRQILLYLLSVGTGEFYFCAPDNYYTNEPVALTMEPDYWLFGRKLPMNKYKNYGGFARWFYGWKVKCVNNPIPIVHDNLRHFTITLKLALVV